MNGDLCQPPGIGVRPYKSLSLEKLGLTDREVRLLASFFRGYDPKGFERALWHISDDRKVGRS